VLLILDDNLNRLASFEDVVGNVDGWMMKSWIDAPSMIVELDRHLREAVLISLDHDLYRQCEEDPEPGSGRDVAEHLSTRNPVCPVIVHSTNSDAAWGMFNCLSATGWKVELVHHLDQQNWIRELWLPVALRLTEESNPSHDV
jgi:hypothetical protein